MIDKVIVPLGIGPLQVLDYSKFKIISFVNPVFARPQIDSGGIWFYGLKRND